MKITRYFLLALVMAWLPRFVFPQATGNVTMALFNGVPSGSCNSAARTIALNTATGDLYSCRAGVWGIVSSGALPPIAPGDTVFGNNTVSSSAPSFFTPGGDVSFSGGNFSVNQLHFGPNALALTNTGIANGNCLTISGTTLIGGACGTGGGGSGTVTSFSSGGLSPLFTTSVATATTTPALSFTFSQAPANTMLANNTAAAAVPTWVTIPTGGGTALDGCTTPTTGNLVCTNSVTGGTGPVGLLTLPYASTGLPTPPSTALAAIAANASGQLFSSTGHSAAWVQIGTGGGGGSGTLTAVTVGNLPPLFTTAVTNPTTAPAVTFTLSDAPPDTILGNSTSSAVAPSWIPIPSGGGTLGGVTILQ